MDCPRCKCDLLSGGFKGVPVQKCKSCDGLLIRQVNLIPILNILSMDLLLAVSLDSQIKTIEDKHDKANCPSCLKEMNKFGYMNSKHTIIENCYKCKLLWIDALELGSMAMLYARTEKRKQYLELQTLSRQSDLLTDSMIIQSIRDGFILGGIISRFTDTE